MAVFKIVTTLIANICTDDSQCCNIVNNQYYFGLFAYKCEDGNCCQEGNKWNDERCSWNQL